MHTIFTAIIGALGIVCIFWSNYQSNRIQELTEINRKLLAETQALKDFSRKMTAESEAFVGKVKESEQVLREEASWSDCAVPAAVTQCVCDSGEEDSKPSSGSLRIVEDLR